MKGIWSYIKENIVVWIYYLIIVFFVAYFIIVLGNYQGDVDGNFDIFKRLDLVVVPLSAISILIGLISSKKNSQRELNIQKAKITMDFSNAYREMMDDMYYTGEINEKYLKVDKKIGAMFSHLQKLDRVYFEEFWYENLLRQFDVTHEEIQTYLNNAHKENCSAYVDICQRQLFLSSVQGASDKLLAYETNTMMSEEISDIKDEIKTEEKKLNDNSISSDEIDAINETIAIMQGHHTALEMKFSIHNRFKVTDILNSLEVLCSSVKFSLIGYDQIYHLIVYPFNSFMTAMYFDIMGSKISAEKESYYLYTNIILMYDKLSEIRLNVLKDNENDAIKNEKRIKRRLGKFGQKDILKMK